MNSSTVKRRFWAKSRIARFWVARSCEPVETRGVGDGFQGGVQAKAKRDFLSTDNYYSIQIIA